MARTAILRLEWVEALSGTKLIHMPLGENRAKPGLQGTATVKVPEEGLFALASIRKPVQFAKKRIGQLAAFRSVRRTPQ